MLPAIAIILLMAVALSVFVVEYSDRQKIKAMQRDAEYWREQIKQAQQQHAPRKRLYREFVEAKRKELMQ